MKKENKSVKKNTALEHESNTLWQGIVVWLLLLIGIVLIWTLLYFMTEFIEQVIAPTFQYHFVFAILVATILSALVILFFRKKVNFKN